MAVVSAWQTVQRLFLTDKAPMQSRVRDEERGKTSNQHRAYQAYVEEEQGETRGEAVTTPRTLMNLDTDLMMSLMKRGNSSWMPGPKQQLNRK